jgi:predicted ABC-type ATPase
MPPQLWVFAGPNGAGKSTIADRYVRGRIPVVNPDNIARSFGTSTGEAGRTLRAGRIAVRERATLLVARRSFAIETTLTGHGELDVMRTARLAGFKVNLVYVGLRNVEYSLSRIEERVARGGHDVALADVLRRFDRSTANIPKAMALADRVILLDNSGKRLKLIHWREDGRMKYTAPAPPPWAATALSSVSEPDGHAQAGPRSGG